MWPNICLRNRVLHVQKHLSFSKGDGYFLNTFSAEHQVRVDYRRKPKVHTSIQNESVKDLSQGSEQRGGVITSKTGFLKQGEKACQATGIRKRATINVQEARAPGPSRDPAARVENLAGAGRAAPMD